jgi:hypothetical protein
VGWTCGMHGRGEKIVQGFGGKPRRKETTRKTEDVEGRMGSEWVLGNWLDVEWVRLVQDKGQWRAVVNAVMNLRLLAPRK